MTHTTRTLLHVYPSFALGGAQRRFLQIANHFGADYRHLIVALDGKSEAFAQFDASVDAAMIPLARRSAGMPATVGAFVGLLTRLRPDLVITSNWGSIDAAIANLVCRRPHLHLEDGFGPEEAARQLPRRIWTRRLVLRHSLVLLPSRSLMRIARDQWKLPRLRYVANGIDCARFEGVAQTSVAERFGIARDRPVIGTVAALRREKNLSRLIECFALLRRHSLAQLVIVGDGPERARLEAETVAAGLAGQVIFTGNHQQPEQLLACFDLFVLSSDTEQMPLSLLEAMASGLPAAATDVGDVRIMLPPESQEFIVPLDAGRLADACLPLLMDAARRRAVGDANRAWVRRHYDEQAMLDAYRGFYDGVLD